MRRRLCGIAKKQLKFQSKLILCVCYSSEVDSQKKGMQIRKTPV